MSHKLDIFLTLKNIDRKNINFLDEISEEEQKGFFPMIVVQWFVGIRDPLQIWLTNELVNPFIFSISKHPKLIYKLLCTCSSGKEQKYGWLKKKKSSKFPRSIKVVQTYYNYSRVYAEDALKCLTKDDILDLAEELGYQKEDIKVLKSELVGF